MEDCCRQKTLGSGRFLRVCPLVLSHQSCWCLHHLSTLGPQVVQLERIQTKELNQNIFIHSAYRYSKRMQQQVRTEVNYGKVNMSALFFVLQHSIQLTLCFHRLLILHLMHQNLNGCLYTGYIYSWACSKQGFYLHIKIPPDQYVGLI